MSLVTGWGWCAGLIDSLYPEEYHGRSESSTPTIELARGEAV